MQYGGDMHYDGDLRMSIRLVDPRIGSNVRVCDACVSLSWVGNKKTYEGHFVLTFAHLTLAPIRICEVYGTNIAHACLNACMSQLYVMLIHIMRILCVYVQPRVVHIGIAQTARARF